MADQEVKQTPIADLHNQLLKDNYAVPKDIKEFETTFQNPDASKELFDQLSKDGYAIPKDYNQFTDTFGLKKKDVSSYGLPTKEVLSQMFGNIGKDTSEITPKDTEDSPEQPDQLKVPEYSGVPQPDLRNIIATNLSNERMGAIAQKLKMPDISVKTPNNGYKDPTTQEAINKNVDKEIFKQHVQDRIDAIDKELSGMKDKSVDMTGVAGISSISTGPLLQTPVTSEDADALLKEKDRLKMTLSNPTRLDYILGKAYNQSIIGMSDAILNGEKRAPDDWLKKFDSNTLTDATAITLGFFLDNPVFAGGAKLGEMAIKPFVNNLMVKSLKKLTEAGIEEQLAKKLVLTGVGKVIKGMASGASALGSYSTITSALSDWSQPGASFDDIRWGQAFKKGAEGVLLGIGTGGLGAVSSAIAQKASAIPNLAGRIATKAVIGAGGLTAESALFSYGGALLEGKPIKSVTKDDFLSTMAMLGMLKVSGAIQKPKESVINLYKSLQFDPGKPNENQFLVDLSPRELEILHDKNTYSGEGIYKDLAKDDEKLATILNDDNVPALLKQKALWATRGVAQENVNLNADKITQNGELVDIHNKEGVLIDQKKFRSNEEAQQASLDMGLQLEDNKMQMQAASLPIVDKIKVLSKMKEKGTDPATVLNALDKPVADRTPDENKIVGDFAASIPKKEIETEEEHPLINTGEEKENKPISEFPEGIKPSVQIRKSGTDKVLVKNKEGKEVSSITFGTIEENGEKLWSIKQAVTAKGEEGKGLSTNVYKYAMENLPEGYTGIISPKETRKNETTIPRIHEKLKDIYDTETRDNGDIIFRPKKIKEVSESKQEVSENNANEEKTPLKEVPVQKNKRPLFKAGSRSATVLDKTPADFHEAAMQFFVGGGKLNTQDFMDHTGLPKNSPEIKSLIQVLSPKGVKMDIFHEHLENSFGMEDKGPMDMINELVELVNKFPSRGKMLSELERRMKTEDPFEPTQEEITKQENDEKMASIIRDSGGFNEQAIDKAMEAGIISKDDYETFKNELENENIDRAERERESADEEARLAEESGHEGGNEEVPPSKKESGDEKNTKVDEEKINKPNLEKGTGEGNIVPSGTKPDKTGVTEQGKEESGTKNLTRDEILLNIQRSKEQNPSKTAYWETRLKEYDADTDKLLARYTGSGLNDKEAITLDATYNMEKNEGKFPTGFKTKEVNQVMPKLLSQGLIHKPTLDNAGVIRLTDKGKQLAEKYQKEQQKKSPLTKEKHTYTKEEKPWLSDEEIKVLNEVIRNQGNHPRAEVQKIYDKNNAVQLAENRRYKTNESAKQWVDKKFDEGYRYTNGVLSKEGSEEYKLAKVEKDYAKIVEDNLPARPKEKVEQTPTQKELPTTKDQISVTLGGRTWKDYPLHVYPDGRVDIDHFGRKTLTPDQYEIIPPKKEENSFGVLFKNKNYTEVDQVQDALEKGDITFEESKPLMEQVRQFEEGLKIEAQKKSSSMGKKLISNTDEAEKNIKKNNDELKIRLIPPDVIEMGNTALWKQLIKPRDAVADWIAKKLQQGGMSQTNALRWISKSVTNWFGGLGRTQADMFGKKGIGIGKLEMMGTVKEFAPYEAKQLSKKLLDLVNSDPELLKRVRDALDPEIAEKPLVYGDLTLSEKNLYTQLRELNTWVHETNYANGFLPTETYLKFKDATGDSKYIARMYDTYELPKEIVDALNEYAKSGGGGTKIQSDIFKAREELDDWKRDHAITDPVYLTAKRVMQTIQNQAVKQYMDLVLAEHPEFVRKVKKGEPAPKGFKMLSGSYKWGDFRNRAVANHIVEDFTGFFYSNHVLNMTYDAMKLFDRNKLNQFYKKYNTVYNPFVQAGNFTGNLFFSSIAGINPTHLLAEMPSAIKDSKAGPDEYKLVLKSGLLGSTGLTGDMTPVTALNTPIINGANTQSSFLKKAAKAFGAVDDAATNLYQGADNVAKYAAYKVFRGQGLSHEMAVRRTYDAFQNYATVGKTWDFASKTPLIGNKFVKFQADLQRILVNGLTTSPITTIGTLMLVKLLGNIASNRSGETDEEKEIRESRKGVAKIPLPFGMSVPLSFKIGKKEVNVARYLSPLYLYRYGDSETDASELSKFLPFQLQKVDDKKIPQISFSDPALGWIGQVLFDRDFRSSSIQTPEATPYNNPNYTWQERVANAMNYAARSQVPFYKSANDMVDGIQGNLDYYGRKRTWSDAILNNIVKIQEFDKPELKNYVEKNLSYLINRYTSLAAFTGNANAQFLKDMDNAKKQGLSDEALSRRYQKNDKLRSARMQKSWDEQIPVMQELERLTKVYQKWYPQDPTIQDNFDAIEAGKSRRFNVIDDVDIQKKYPAEYDLLRENKILKKPSIPAFWEGTQLSDDDKKAYSNTYWSEYLRNLDENIGLTKEEIQARKEEVIREEKSTSHAEPDKITSLSSQASKAAERAKKEADSQLRDKIDLKRQ